MPSDFHNWKQASTFSSRSSSQRTVAVSRVVSGQWSVVSGQWSVASGQWPVASGQWSVASGQWPVASGQWPVASGQWSVASGQWPTSLPARATPQHSLEGCADMDAYLLTGRLSKTKRGRSPFHAQTLRGGTAFDLMRGS